MRNVLLVLAVVLCAAAPATAQTRLSLLGGGIVPFGDLDEGADPSLMFGLRAEFQPVNPLGQARLLAFSASAAYASLDRDSGSVVVEGTSDPYLLEVTGGVRVYSRVAPFFVTGVAGYSRVQGAGGGDAVNGATAGVGLGFVVPVVSSLVEVEGVLHQVLAEDDVSFQYLTVLLGLGLPF